MYMLSGSICGLLLAVTPNSFCFILNALDISAVLCSTSHIAGVDSLSPSSQSKSSQLFKRSETLKLLLSSQLFWVLADLDTWADGMRISGSWKDLRLVSICASIILIHNIILPLFHPIPI